MTSPHGVIDTLTALLYELSSLLLVPTLVLLLFFMAGALVMLGGLGREWAERRARAGRWLGFLHSLRAGHADTQGFQSLHLNGYPRRLQRSTRDIEDRPRLVKKCLEDIELDMARRLGRLSFVTRTGPMLGLVGTLVPLGPALAALAAGDMQSLSGNLVIAFTTTVFGIIVGSVAFGTAIVRRGWYEQDMSDLEFVAGSFPGGGPTHG